MRLKLLAAMTAFVALFAFVGCGDDDSSDTGSGTDGDSSDIVAEAQENVDTYFSNTSVEPEDQTGPSAVADQKVVFIDAGTATPSGSAGAEAFEEGSEILGWDGTVFDGEFTPSVQQEGIRQAISQQADGIILYGVDCPVVKAALEEARDADLKIVGVSSQDCNDGEETGEPLFDAQIEYPPAPGSDENLSGFSIWGAYGAAQADWLIAETDGEAKVLLFEVPDFAVTLELANGFKERMSDCTSCEIVDTVELGVNDFGPQMQDIAEQALLRNPDANALNGAYADPMELGIAAAVVSAGRAQDMAIVAGTDNTNKLELAREDKGLNAGFVQTIQWDIWGGLDQLNRVLADEDTAVTGEAVTMFDQDNNLPPSGPFIPEADYEAVFTDIWTGEG